MQVAHQVASSDMQNSVPKTRELWSIQQVEDWEQKDSFHYVANQMSMQPARHSNWMKSLLKQQNLPNSDSTTSQVHQQPYFSSLNKIIRSAGDFTNSFVIRPEAKLTCSAETHTL